MTVWCKPAKIGARLTNELQLRTPLGCLVEQGSWCHLRVLYALCPHGLSTLCLCWALLPAPCSTSGALRCFVRRHTYIRQGHLRPDSCACGDTKGGCKGQAESWLAQYACMWDLRGQQGVEHELALDSWWSCQALPITMLQSALGVIE